MIVFLEYLQSIFFHWILKSTLLNLFDFQKVVFIIQKFKQYFKKYFLEFIVMYFGKYFPEWYLNFYILESIFWNKKV